MKCENCGAEFTPSKYKPKQKYCSRQCRQKASYKRNGVNIREYGRKKYWLDVEATRAYKREYYITHKWKVQK